MIAITSAICMLDSQVIGAPRLPPAHVALDEVHTCSISSCQSMTEPTQPHFNMQLSQNPASQMCAQQHRVEMCMRMRSPATLDDDLKKANDRLA
jgi:hypothetical protein